MRVCRHPHNRNPAVQTCQQLRCWCIANDLIVGTLPKGYVGNVPLPRVQVRQSAQSHQVHTIPDYCNTPYVVPAYVAPRSLVERAAYAFSPAWHAIAINT
jgi:hypothetical protein